MLTYLIRRVIYAIIAMFAVSVISFVIINLPAGDFVTTYIATQAATGNVILADEADNLREVYGLNDPIYVQYYKWMTRILTGNLGFSFEFNQPVSFVIQQNLLTTILLALFAIVFVWVVGIPIGIYSAVKQYSVGDYVATFFGFLGLGIPDFLIALVVAYLLFDLTGFLATDLFSPEYRTAAWSFAKAWDLTKHMILPVIILGTAGTATLIRIMRANLLDELKKPYVTTARAKGVSEFQLIMKYPVRYALNPALSLTAYIFPFILSGSVVLSVVLDLPTIGRDFLRALTAQDIYLSGAVILGAGWLTIIGTFFSDLLLAWADPRIRLGDD